MTAGFQQETLDTRSADGRNDVLLTELDFIDLDGRHYKVPMLAETDGGSTPRLCWLIPGFEPTGKHWFEWILHDSAYRGTLLVLDGCRWVDANLTRLESDQLLDRALSLDDMNKLARRAVFKSLRAAGWKHFRKP